ncbi:MAG: nuclear transport factor 2 family protein [Sandaracinaceae bacterium]
MDRKQLETLEAQLNGRIQQGDVLGALAEHYAEDVQMREGSAKDATVGREANHERLSGFLGGLKKFNSATLHSSAVGEGVTMSEWTFDMVGGDGTPIIWNEVIRRQWRDGLVVDERYYNTGG